MKPAYSLAFGMEDKGIRWDGGGNGWKSPGSSADFTQPDGSTFRINGTITRRVERNAWHIGEAYRGEGTISFTRIGGYYAWKSDSQSRYFPGDIAEVLIYDRELTEDERNQVGSYLAKKYRINTSYKH